MTIPDTEQLLEMAERGEDDAREKLLTRHRGRLRQMIAVRLDRRVAARIDPSDVVQEALAEAADKLPGYLRDRPLAFYPWLRRLAWERLVKLHQYHLHAQRRSTLREVPAFPDESAMELMQRLSTSGTSPSRHFARKELKARMSAAMASLPERDREVLVMRYLEQLTNPEIAAALGVSEGAVKARHLRAITRIRKLLGEDLGEGGL